MFGSLSTGLLRQLRHSSRFGARTALPHTFQRGIARALLVALGAALLFLHCVSGERATNGCPRDEICSDLTPEGLIFVGPTMYNNDMIVLGPIIEGGTYSLTVTQKASNAGAVPPYAVESTNPSVLSAAVKAKPYATSSTSQTIVITGKKVGTSELRVVDPDTDAYFDSIQIDVRKVYAVAVRAVNGHQGEAYRGCPQMIGVELIVDREGTEVRAFDESVQLRLAGSEMAREPSLWDCFIHDVPANATTVEYEVVAGGKVWLAKLATRDLADDGLTACPPVTID